MVRERILRSDFERIKYELWELKGYPYLNIRGMEYGKIYNTLKGGVSKQSLMGAKIISWIISENYHTESKAKPESKCYFCKKEGNKENKFEGGDYVEHLVTNCRHIENKYGYLWHHMIQGVPKNWDFVQF